MFIDVHWYSLMFIDVHWCSLVFSDIQWCSLMFIDVHWCSLMFIGIQWYSVMFIDVHWYSLMFIDVHWCSLIFVDVHWCSLMFIGIQWYSVMFIDVHWCSLVFSDIQWCSLMFIDVHWCSLYSLIFIDIHWCSLMFIDFHWWSLMFIDVHWYIWYSMIFSDIHWCSLMFFDVHWWWLIFMQNDLLIFVDLRWSSLIFIDTCPSNHEWRMIIPFSAVVLKQKLCKVKHCQLSRWPHFKQNALVRICDRLSHLCNSWRANAMHDTRVNPCLPEITTWIGQKQCCDHGLNVCVYVCVSVCLCVCARGRGRVCVRVCVTQFCWPCVGSFLAASVAVNIFLQPLAAIQRPYHTFHCWLGGPCIGTGHQISSVWTTMCFWQPRIHDLHTCGRTSHVHACASAHTHTQKCSCAHEITFLGGTNKCQVRVVGNLECVQFQTGWLTHVYTVQGGTHLPSKHQSISAKGRWHWWQRGGLECAPWWGWIGNLLGSEAKKGFLIKLPSQCLTILYIYI